jgi:PiT family inorganic phosphate transporter
MGSNLILVLVIGAAVCFDFTNGFHDTANAMATSIATGALKPIVAVLISAVLNFVGAFISISVATTIAKGIVPSSATAAVDGLTIVEAALIGAITWNLITWYFTIPSSSSHALIGGVIGATLVASGSGAINWHTCSGRSSLPPSCRRSSPAASR